MKSFLDYENYEIHNDRLVEERNNEIRQIEKDVIDISEIMNDLALFVYDQGESIESVMNNIKNSEIATNEAVESLEKTVIYVNKRRNILRNMGIIVGGATVGAFGFIAGPIIGAVTLISGGAIGTGIAYITNKII